jgi:hypothetical protein
MASAKKTRDHDTIREWVESRGGIPTVVKGTEGLLRIDFVEGAESGGRESTLEETSWDEWFQIFDDNDLTFLHSPEDDSRFFKLVRSDGSDDEEEESEEEEDDDPSSATRSRPSA